MLTSIRTAAISAIHRQIQKFFPPLAPQLSLAGMSIEQSFSFNPLNTTTTTAAPLTPLEDSLWFAVPKSKVSRGKKRMKTTVQKRIRVKDNIVIDKRTGELTLKHKLPYNWKNYLPENAEYAP